MPSLLRLLSKRSLALALLAFCVSCKGGDSGGTPTTPTRSVPTLTIAPFTASLTQTTDANRYAIRLGVRETGGQAGVTLGAIELTFTDAAGRPAVSNPENAWPSTRLNAGGSMDARSMTATDDREGRQNFTRVTARVSYSDDSQVAGSVSATIDIQQPAPPPAQSTFTIAGVVSEDSDGDPVAGATVTILDGVNAGRASPTDGNGYYSIPALRSGSFTLRATKTGYEAADRGLTLNADTRIDLRLRGTGPSTPTPPAPPTPTPPPPPPGSMTCASAPTTAPCGRPTARCNDGTYSCSQNRPGTCSSHDGVQCWICPGALCDPRAQSWLVTTAWPSL